MKQLAMGALVNMKYVGMIGLFLLPAAAFLWLVDLISMPIGGLALFSAIFMAAVSGFACAVVVFYLASKFTSI